MVLTMNSVRPINWGEHYECDKKRDAGEIELCKKKRAKSHEVKPDIC